MTDQDRNITMLVDDLSAKGTWSDNKQSFTVTDHT